MYRVSALYMGKTVGASIGPEDGGLLDFFHCEGEEIVLREFTGLYDKNKRPIYEHDIVRKNGRIHEVLFKDGAFVIMLTHTHDGTPYYLDVRHDLFNMEIIGNIWEHPNLLKPASE